MDRNCDPPPVSGITEIEYLNLLKVSTPDACLLT